MDIFKILVSEQDPGVLGTLMASLRDPAMDYPLHIDELGPRVRLAEGLASAPFPYDVVIFNWDEAAHDSLGTLPHLVERFPYTSFIANSASNSLLIPQQALNAGASGFFRRDSPLTLIRQVVDLVLGGEAFAIPAHLRSPVGITGR